MTNLSDLFPAGAGKQVSFVASGTLSNGQAVGLKTNGQVEAITGSSEGLGTAGTFTASPAYPNYVTACYDSNADKVVAFFTDGNVYMNAAVGTVSGTSISFGTAVVLESSSSSWISPSYDPVAQKIVVSWTISGSAKAAVGTVSGTTISLGTYVTFSPGNSMHTNAVYDVNANKTVIAWRDSADSNNGAAIVGTVSGTNISFGTKVTFDTVYVQFPKQVYDAQAQKISIVYQDATGGDGWSIVGTVSGTSISFGTAFRFTTDDLEDITGAYDSVAQKVVYSFRDLGNSSKGTTIVGTISGTNISFGTEVVFTSSAVNKVGTCFQTNAGQVVVAYQDSGDTKGKVVGGTVSGTSITFGSIVIYRDAGAFYGGNVPVYDSVAGKNVIVYSTDANAPAYQGQAIVQFLGNTNNTSFIGIADAAISSAASGNITVKGGIATSLGGGTYVVTVANPGSGNRYYIDGVLQQKVDMLEGFTYKFDQSAASNSGHPLRLSTTSNGTHAGGSEYTTGVTTVGTPGSAGAYTQIVVAASAPTLYYYCSVHSLMGSTAFTLTGFVANSDYYVQADGSITTSSAGVKIGRAMSSTALNLEYSS